MTTPNKIFILLLVFVISTFAYSQAPPANYDEDKIPDYELPDPLVLSSGKRVSDAKEWEEIQRPEILKKFADHVYGRFPESTDIHFKVIETDSSAVGGKAIRKQVRVFFATGLNSPKMDLLIYLPNKSGQPVPVFVGLNFCGNQCISTDEGINLTSSWVPNNEDHGFIDHKATDVSRGLQSRRWPIEEIIDRGYGLATVYYGDLEPDHPEGWKEGIRTTLQENLKIKPEEWSAMGAWAWGLSRIQDYLKQEPGADASQTILTGHSRLGKAALWAGANDERFAVIISNDSGEGGTALSRRIYGETIANLNTSFPYWFVSKYEEYNNKPEQLPVDQHMLLALMAPRPLYVASAEDDQWADPKGEFLSALHAGEVYDLYQKKGIGQKDMPAVNQPVGETIRYHIRTGKHDITDYDWKQFLDFADKHLK